MDGEFGWICFFAQRFTDAGSAAQPAGAPRHNHKHLSKSHNLWESGRGHTRETSRREASDERITSQIQSVGRTRRIGTDRTTTNIFYHISDKNLNLGQDGYPE